MQHPHQLTCLKVSSVLQEMQIFRESRFKKQGIQNEYLDKFNYEEYGGMPILGVDGNVVIGHGISNDKAIKNMILHTSRIAVNKLSESIKEALNDE